MFKKDFPIFENNPWLVFLDSTASTQKPKYVIDGICDFLSNSYSNIHRWSYILAEKSEDLYIASKKKVAQYINASTFREIVYTYNSNYASNFLAYTFAKNWVLEKWDKVIVSITEHHANIVPWLQLKEDLGIELEFINIKDDFTLDIDDLKNKLTSNTKIVSITWVSNVTWEIYPLKEIWKIVKDFNIEIFYIVDASQSFPHLKTDVVEIWCDAMFFTAHKFMAEAWIAVLWMKEEFLRKFKPIFSGWWAICSVKCNTFCNSVSLPDKYEPGTPNINWAVSILKALEYIDQIWWYEKIEEIEAELIEYCLEKFKNLKNIKLIWWTNPKTKVWVFSFVVDNLHSLDVADYLATKNICVRAWQHCAEPFLDSLNISHTLRVSLYLYNDKNDIDRFFEELQNAIEYLS